MVTFESIITSIYECKVIVYGFLYCKNFSLIY